MPHYSLRTLLILLAVLSALLAGAVQWWRKPYVLYGTYPNAIRAWEQTNQRTFDGGLMRLSIIRYYQSGRKAYEYNLADDAQHYWSPEGHNIDGDKWSRLYHWQLPHVDRDPRSRHAWPFERLSQGQ